MDHFGIGAAMLGMAQGYISNARRTGRTTSLLNSVTSGDRVVFVDQRQANQFDALCRARGITVDCIVVPPNRPWDYASSDKMKRSEGRTLFDHAWVEQFYLNLINKAVGDIDYLQARLSSPQQTPREERCSLTAMQRAVDHGVALRAMDY